MSSTSSASEETEEQHELVKHSVRASGNPLLPAEIGELGIPEQYMKVRHGVFKGQVAVFVNSESDEDEALEIPTLKTKSPEVQKKTTTTTSTTTTSTRNRKPAAYMKPDYWPKKTTWKPTLRVKATQRTTTPMTHPATKKPTIPTTTRHPAQLIKPDKKITSSVTTVSNSPSNVPWLRNIQIFYALS